jgi:hypothetical protein
MMWMTRATTAIGLCLIGPSFIWRMAVIPDDRINII